MAWAYISASAAKSGADASATTLVLAYAQNVAAGSLLTCSVGWRSPGGETISVAGSLNGALTQIGSTITHANLGVTWAHAVFYFPNSGSGAETITATWSTGVQNRILLVEEFSGIDTSAPLDKSTGQAQSTPGTGTDAVSSGATAATTADNDLAWGASINSAGSPGVYTAGTGFTAGLSGTAITSLNSAATEYKNVTPTGAVTATFTQQFDNDPITFAVTFKQASGGGGVTYPRNHSTLGVGRM